MPNELVAGEIVEMKVYCSLGNQVSINTRHYKVGDVISGAGRTDVQVAEYLSDHFKDMFTALMNEHADFRGVTVRCIRDPLPEAAIKDEGFATGQIIGDALPSTVCGIITLKTGLSGPAFRGRIFVPFPGEGSNSVSGTPTTVYRDDLNVLGAGLVETLTVIDGADGVVLVPVLSRRPNYVTNTPLTGYLSRLYWGRQKRRDGKAHGDIMPF